MVLHNVSAKVFEMLNSPSLWISEGEMGAQTTVAERMQIKTIKTVGAGAGCQQDHRKAWVEEQGTKEPGKIKYGG